MKKIILTVSIIFTLYSCSDPGCGEPNPFYNKEVRIALLNSKTGKDLIAYGTSGGIYDPSRVKVTRNGLLDDTTVGSDFEIDDWTMPPELVYDSIYQLYYLMDLYTYDGRYDQDTLDFKYSIYNGDCPDEIKYMELKYNDSLYYSGKETFFLYLRLDKD